MNFRSERIYAQKSNKLIFFLTRELANTIRNLNDFYPNRDKRHSSTI